MGKISSQRRIFLNDFKEDYQELVNQLSVPINTNTEILFQTLNKNVSLQDNMYAEIKDLTVTVNSSGTPLGTSQFQSSLGTAILGMQVLRARHSTDNNTFVTSAPFISFSQLGKIVTINNIAGLPANETFVLTFVAYGS